jgi:hypothetical protein
VISYLTFTADQLRLIQPSMPTNAQAHFNFWSESIEEFRALKVHLSDLDNGELEDRIYRWYRIVRDDMQDLVNWRTMPEEEYLAFRGSNDSYFYQINGDTLHMAFQTSAENASVLIRKLQEYVPKSDPARPARAAHPRMRAVGSVPAGQKPPAGKGDRPSSTISESDDSPSDKQPSGGSTEA